MGEVLCSTENSPFLIIDHIHAKINRVCCAALAIGKRCMNVRKNKLFKFVADHRIYFDIVSVSLIDFVVLNIIKKIYRNYFIL